MFTKEVWLAAIEGTEFPPERADDPATLIERHEDVAARWRATVADIERRGAWDDRLIDALCDPPESFVMSSVVAHVLTFSVARRQLVRQFIRAGGGEIDEGDPINWLRKQLGEDTGRPNDPHHLLLRHHARRVPRRRERLPRLAVRPGPGRERPDELRRVHQGIGAIAMGATTYQWILDHNAKTGEKWAYEMPSWVFTHRTFDEPDGDVRFVQGDIAEVHAAMVEAAGGKDLWVVGGGDLAAQFAEAKLLDELVALHRAGDPRRRPAAVPAEVRPGADRAGPQRRLRLCAVRREGAARG